MDGVSSPSRWLFWISASGTAILAELLEEGRALVQTDSPRLALLQKTDACGGSEAQVGEIQHRDAVALRAEQTYPIPHETTFDAQMTPLGLWKRLRSDSQQGLGSPERGVHRDANNNCARGLENPGRRHQMRVRARVESTKDVAGMLWLLISAPTFREVPDISRTGDGPFPLPATGGIRGVAVESLGRFF
jgi:hypothetical protein